MSTLSKNTFPGKLAVQQRVLPRYRVLFFETLAAGCEGGLSIFAGDPLPQEGIPAARTLDPATPMSRPGQASPQALHHTFANNRHFLNPQHPLYFCLQPGIVNWLEETNPDALIIEANPRYPSNSAAIRWMRDRKRPVLGWGLGAPPLSGLFAGLRARSRQKQLARLDGVIAYSDRGAKEYARLGTLPDGRIFTAHNAVAPPPEGPPPSRSFSPSRTPSVIFVGRLQSRKRLDLLLQACSELELKMRPRLTIVGSGPDEKALRDLAKSIYPRTRFAGELFGEALAAKFKEADLFVLPGTGGLALQEAMSHGLPVIAAEGDGTQNDLVTPRNGWLVEPGSLESLLAALRMALSSPHALRAMGLESYRIVKEEINLDRMADRFVEAVNACVEWNT